MKKVWALGMVAGLLALASNASAFQKGQGLFAINVGGGEAEWLQPAGGSGYITSQSPLPQITVGAELWQFTSNDMAWNVSGGAGFFSETDQPGTAAAPGAPDLKSTLDSWHARLGADHFARVGERAQLYSGGGVYYQSGQFKYDDGVTTTTSPAAVGYGLDGRIGVICAVSKSVWMGGRIGHSFGLANGSQDGAKSSWWTSSTYGDASLAFAFGHR
ncbi:MAG TPA: hypothetical protein VMI75_10500 [Polyangiaceae bacterium]|nr:hypothetical protein [Polyangiaceae bacterium]